MENQSSIPSLKNPKFQYVPSANTDILKRFRSLGWVPPSELKEKK